MKRRTPFWHGVIVAAALALVSSVLFSGLGLVLGVKAIIKLAVPALSLIYLLYLMHAVQATTGRILTLTAWGLMTIACLWLNIPLPFYLLIHAGAIWLVRAFHAYTSLVPAIMDAFLSAFAVMAFTWAFMRTGSVMLATWCFFLVQALWVFIPKALVARADSRKTETVNQPFDQARRRADAALQQLFNQAG